MVGSYVQESGAVIGFSVKKLFKECLLPLRPCVRISGGSAAEQDILFELESVGNSFLQAPNTEIEIQPNSAKIAVWRMK